MGGAILTTPATVFAQDTETAAASADSGEIVVTAQRREEKLQEVPLAITAASGEDLANHGTSDLRGISQLAPSLNIAIYPNSSDTVSLTMRGQGVADAGQITKDGGVGLYVDGFYISRPQAALLDLGDPERIEVLRGPQGTLYGRNTTGGAVNIISSKPTGEWGGNASLSYGSRNYVRGLATINLPAFGDLAVKGTILYTDQDGYVKNFGSLHDYHEMGQLAGRVAARWTPSDSFTLDYAFDRGRVTSTQPYYINPDLEATIPGYTADKDHTYAPLDIGQSKAHFTDHQLTLTWDVSDALTLRSLSSYRKTDAYQDVNYGVGQAYPIPGGDLTTVQQHQYRAKQYTQEFQIIGSIGDLIEYTGGLYYFKETGSHYQAQQLTGTLVGGYVDTERLVEAKSISKAAYLQATLTPPILEERLKLTVGGRYTEDKRRATRNQWYFGYNFETDVKNSQKFHNFSPSVNLAMQWTPDVMTYVRYSKGYKAGGSAEGGLDFTATYGPEKVEAWELGLKSEFLDRKVTFNASLFYNKFRDLQVDFGVDPVDLTKVATVNAGRATVKGAEVELGIRPTSRLSLRASYAYLDPNLKSIVAPTGTTFDPALNPNSPVSVGDDVTNYFTLPFVPRHSLTVSGDWVAFDDGERTLTAFASFAYQGSVYTSSVAGPDIPGRELWKNQARKVVNARLVWEQPVGDVDVSFAVFVNNLLDRRSREFVVGIGSQIDTLAGPGGYFSRTAPYSEPRVIGAEIKAAF
ncbi:TonB-dependent receptor [Croceicoccus estronivorus]|uniref:TonB-dependent receptor n=1 Tax=Croceicoccus estronivorus TaxID=1172626 RepID=UPI00147942D1|nr:TonB-dependent receptor [Croceicoccus estronivorus]